MVSIYLLHMMKTWDVPQKDELGPFTESSGNILFACSYRLHRTITLQIGKLFWKACAGIRREPLGRGVSFGFSFGVAQRRGNMLCKPILAGLSERTNAIGMAGHRLPILQRSPPPPPLPRTQKRRASISAR